MSLIGIGKMMRARLKIHVSSNSWVSHLLILSHVRLKWIRVWNQLVMVLLNRRPYSCFRIDIFSRNILVPLISCRIHLFLNFSCCSFIFFFLHCCCNSSDSFFIHFSFSSYFSWTFAIMRLWVARNFLILSLLCWRLIHRLILVMSSYPSSRIRR